MKLIIDIPEEVRNDVLTDGVLYCDYDSILRDAIKNSIVLSECKAENLCDSCTNIGCMLQSGIKRSSCAFYMPPHLEPDNCGNYIVQNNSKRKSDDIAFKDDNAVSRLSVRDIIYANAYELEYPDGSSEYVVNRDDLIKYLSKEW